MIEIDGISKRRKIRVQLPFLIKILLSPESTVSKLQSTEIGQRAGVESTSETKLDLLGLKRYFKGVIPKLGLLLLLQQVFRCVMLPIFKALDKYGVISIS